jgi:hypothetical protein
MFYKLYFRCNSFVLSQCSLSASILCSIWKRNNLRLWHQVKETTSQVFERVVHVLEDWKVAHELGRPADTPTPNIPPGSSNMNNVRRRRPASGRQKCNADASFLTSHNKVGIYMCIWDVNGAYALAKIAWFAPLCSVEVDEVLRLRKVMSWVEELGLDVKDFSLDSKFVVDVVNNNNSSNNDFGSTISHCRQLNIHFTHYKIEFNWRQINGVTYELAPISSL